MLFPVALFLDSVFAQTSPECARLGGSCVPVSTCENDYSNLVSGLCPGAADIRCCVPIACNIPAEPGKVFPGGCGPASNCKGRKGTGLCPGPSDIQCCSTAASSVKDPVLSIGTTNLTPRGNRLLVQSESWKTLQLQRPFIDTYPQKAQCANNLGKVLGMAGFSEHYKNLLVMDTINAIKEDIPDASMSRDYVYTEPRNAMSYYATKFSKMYNGYFPIGTVVAGCKVHNCDGDSGDGHISFVCKVTDTVVDAKGQLTKANFHLCHNNWLREKVDPRRVLEDTLGTVGQYMINQNLFTSKIIERQWMNTPWIQLQWTNGVISQVKYLITEIDDLDPYMKFLTNCQPPVAFLTNLNKPLSSHMPII
jgi:hypothetical protein